mmetsp:Transcript_58311/g.185869  ORF Transcript_58311/g.185869 Transcript_58311/m.185869 type:complete len:209 (+) Transcript_58311:606-1232(+)
MAADRLRADRRQVGAVGAAERQEGGREERRGDVRDAARVRQEGVPHRRGLGRHGHHDRERRGGGGRGHRGRARVHGHPRGGGGGAQAAAGAQPVGHVRVGRGVERQERHVEQAPGGAEGAGPVAGGGRRGVLDELRGPVGAVCKDVRVPAGGGAAVGAESVQRHGRAECGGDRCQEGGVAAEGAGGEEAGGEGGRGGSRSRRVFYGRS